MKIDKQTGLAGALDANTQTRSRPRLQRTPNDRKSVGREPLATDNRSGSRAANTPSGFSLQLNQQLSSMQVADGYLGELGEHLSALKLSISRQLSSPVSN